MALNLDVSRTEDIAVVRCRGRIVFGEEADELRRVVLSLLNETKRIVLNLGWIGYIDSSGLATLVASFISARNRGAEIKFAALSPQARRVLTTIHVDRLFEVYDSTEEALKSCAGMYIPTPFESTKSPVRSRPTRRDEGFSVYFRPANVDELQRRALWLGVAPQHE